MLRFILLILVALYFGIPFLYEKALATETKIIKMNGQEWLVTIEPGKEPMFKSLEKQRKVTKLHSLFTEKKSRSSNWPSIKKNQNGNVERSRNRKLYKLVMIVFWVVRWHWGDCPDCKTELVKEETVEIIQKSDFTVFKESVKAQKNLNERIKNTKTKWYLTTYDWMRDVGHPSYICWKVMLTCQHNDPISIQDLYLAKLNASTCSDFQHTFNFTNPISSCQKSTILNL